MPMVCRLFPTVARRVAEAAAQDKQEAEAGAATTASVGAQEGAPVGSNGGLWGDGAAAGADLAAASKGALEGPEAHRAAGLSPEAAAVLMSCVVCVGTLTLHLATLPVPPSAPSSSGR